MRPTPFLWLVLFLVRSPAAEGADALVRLEFLPQAKNQALRLYVLADGDAGFDNKLAASDVKLHQAGGTTPVRFAFGADEDGDGVDELVVIREKTKKGGRAEFRIYRTPSKIWGTTGKPVAKVTPEEIVFGGAGGLVAATAIDRSGLGDELALVIDEAAGQRLEFRPLPSGKHWNAPALTVDLGDPSELGSVRAIASVALDDEDGDGGGGERLLVLREQTDSTRTLAIHVVPTSSASSTSTVLDDPVASYVLPATATIIRQIDSFTAGSPPETEETAPELLVLWDDGAGQSTARYPLPSGLGLALPSPTDTVAGFAGLATHAACSLRRPIPPPDGSSPMSVVGAYRVYVSAGLFGGDSVTLFGHLASGTATIAMNGSAYSLTFPSGEVMPITVTGDGTSDPRIAGVPATVSVIVPSLGFGSTPIPVSLTGTFWFYNKADLDQIALGAPYSFLPPWLIGGLLLSKL